MEPKFYITALVTVVIPTALTLHGKCVLVHWSI